MIITDKFIFVHDPKTGGSFVTSALLKLHDAKWSRWEHFKIIFLRQMTIKGGSRYGDVIFTNMKHKGCHYIPMEYRGRKILATTRNPFDWYVSQYEFGWWKRRYMRKYLYAVPNFQRDYPNFPDLSFAEFIRLANRVFEINLDCPEEIWSQFGWRTRAFANFYFKNPAATLTKMLDEKYISSGEYESDMYENVNFIHTKNLNRNLYNFLLETGYDKEDINFILEMKKVLPLGKGRTKEQKWEKYFTPELEAEIRRKERVLFQIFPEFDARL